MNFIERYIDKKLRRIAWKTTHISNNKKSDTKDLIGRLLLDRHLKKEIELQESIGQSYDASDNKNNGIMENKLNDVELNLSDELKIFLSETSDEQILALYDVEQNFNSEENLVEKNEAEIKQDKGFVFQKIRKNK